MKKIHFYDMQGVLAGSYDLQEGEEMPANATEVPAPELGDGYLARFNGLDWTIENAPGAPK